MNYLNATREGRDSIASTDATRALFGLPPLVTQDGGHRIAGDDSLRLHPRQPRPRARGWLSAVRRLFAT